MREVSQFEQFSSKNGRHGPFSPSFLQINPECDGNINLNHMSMGNSRVELLATAIVGTPDDGGVSKITGLLMGNNLISVSQRL